MIVIIIIFLVAILISLGMLVFQSWQIRTMRIQVPKDINGNLPKLEFRHVEKNMLYLTKRIVLGIVLIVVKYWFIAMTKIKKWIAEDWPKIHEYFTKKPESPNPVKLSFLRRAVIESKIKIRKMKERVKEEHE